MLRLSASAHKRLNDPRLIAKRDEWFARMSHLFDGVEDEFNRRYVYTVEGMVPRPENPDLAYTNPEAWVTACLELLAEQPECPHNRFAPLCVEYPIYGVHFIDKIFGADVFYYEGQWNARYLPTPVGELRMPDLEKDETWHLARRAAKAFVDADVALPLFGLPTLSSALNILINLYGDEALVAMMLYEEAAMHDLQIINNLIRTLHRWYLENIPSQQLQPVISWARTQPPGYGQLCGCSTQLISPDLYSRMIAPLDDALLAEYPCGGMIHLCGAHEQLIPVFRSMKHLRSLQLNDRAAHDLQRYHQGLRDDQILYVTPCAGMTSDQIVAISGGKRVVLMDIGDAPEVLGFRK